MDQRQHEPAERAAAPDRNRAAAPDSGSPEGDSPPPDEAQSHIEGKDPSATETPASGVATPAVPGPAGGDPPP